MGPLTLARERVGRMTRFLGHQAAAISPLRFWSPHLQVHRADREPIWAQDSGGYLVPAYSNPLSLPQTQHGWGSPTNRLIVGGMGDLCRLIWCAVVGLFRSRTALQAEILVLRHQPWASCRRCVMRLNRMGAPTSRRSGQA